MTTRSLRRLVIRFSFARTASKFVHAVTDAEERHQRVKPANGQQPARPGGINERGHKQPAPVLSYGIDDTSHHVLRVQDGQQPGRSRLDVVEHPRVGIRGAHHGSDDLAVLLLEFQAQGFIKADDGEFAGTIVGQIGRAREAGGRRDRNNVAATTRKFIWVLPTSIPFGAVKAELLDCWPISPY